MSAQPPLAGRRIGLLTAWASRANGGVFEAVVAQAEIIRALGGEPAVFALADPHGAEGAARLAPTPVVHAAVLGPGAIGYSRDLLPALLAAELDCLHLHGIWMHPSRVGAQWARASGRAYLVSPHGMLDPWITARGRWKKALARLGYERASWAAATRLHALTGCEAADIARETGRRDAVVIANAGPAAAAPAATQPDPHAVYIGRIHPKKNLLSLIDGWEQASLPPEARLTLAGWGDAADVAALTARVAAAGPGVRFVGPVFGEAKAALLAAARFVVLPSLSEGLPMAMLEAWAAGVPTIMSEDCNLPEGFAAGAARCCGHDGAAIARSLGDAFALDPRGWQAMADAAHHLAATRFSASAIAAAWAGAYGAAIANPLQGARR